MERVWIDSLSCEGKGIVLWSKTSRHGQCELTAVRERVAVYIIIAGR